MSYFKLLVEIYDVEIENVQTFYGFIWAKLTSHSEEGDLKCSQE